MILSEDKENQIQEFWELLRKKIEYLSKEKASKDGKQWSDELTEDEDKIGIYLGSSNNMWLYIKSGSSKRCDQRTNQMLECSRLIREKIGNKRLISNESQINREHDGRSIKIKRTWARGNVQEWPEIANWVKDQFEFLREIVLECPFSRFYSRKFASPKDTDNLTEILISEDDDTELDDGNDEDATLIPSRYNVSSYGWDSDVEGLVRRLKRGDIFIPKFQRRFVWNQPEKSFFIESLILRLPVPNVFLAHDPETNNLNIVDGQQRLISLRDYLDGKFALTGEKIRDDLKGCYFSHDVAKTQNSKVLSYRDARTLSDAVLHSIVIKPDPAQDDPELGNEYNQAIIQIFSRLNKSGNPLQAHEIRTSIFHGRLDNLIRELNEHSAWRDLFGKHHPRLKDMELILRFIALREDYENYKPPMSSFLDNFMERNREISEEHAKSLADAFRSVITLVKKTLGEDGLRSGKTLMVSRFDAVMSGFDTYLKSYSEPSERRVVRLLSDMEDDDDYKWSVDEFVNRSDRVKKRIERARAIFGT